MLDHNWNVNGTTTSEEKLARLKESGIKAGLLKLSSADIVISDPSVFDCDVAYINIPPRRRIPEIETRYPIEIAALLSRFNKDTKIIFISSTGVYPDNHQQQSEELSPAATKESGRALVNAEALVREQFNDWVILRLSGLAGPNREPGHWFSGRTDLPNGLNPVNMVHLEDCKMISKMIIESDDINQRVYNVCSDAHPSKIEFYNEQCMKLGIELPMFKQELGPHKVVQNDLIKEELDYEFIYPDPRLF